MFKPSQAIVSCMIVHIQKMNENDVYSTMLYLLCIIYVTQAAVHTSQFVDAFATCLTRVN